MCGIAAIFNYRHHSPVDRAELGRMLAHMQRRGPDGSGEWYGLEGAIGLGHRRLAIIDLSENGAQPMASADGKVVVSFNGEIYNYRELRAELESQGRRFRSQSDTEVLLHLYQVHGRDMLANLRGMFAFAIWDETRRGLLLARDPFGIKPLYYSDDGTTFRAASQVKTLLAGGAVDTSPEPAGHVGFFLWGNVPAPFTMYRGIANLPAGTSLWIDEKSPADLQTYFSIPEFISEAEQTFRTQNPEPSSQSLTPGTPNSELLRSALVDSVRHHLIADVPVGVFLSSGLDSTVLTALAAETSATLRTVTLGFEEFRGTPDDETPLAEKVAAQYGAQHQTIWINQQDFRDNFARVMQAMDQPSCDGINSYFVSRAAAQAGLKVALSGLGGDELFGGYPSFTQIPRLVSRLELVSRWPSLNRSVRAVSAPWFRRLTSPKYAGLLEYGGTYGGAYLLRRGMFMPWELPQVLDVDLIREGLEKLQTLARLDTTTQTIKSPGLRVSALEMTWYMRHQLLRDTDWASMDHSVEVRTPLVDLEVLRQVVPLRLSQPAADKQAMARTPRLPLPDAVLNRPKTGFVVPVRDWLVQEDTDFSHERGLRGWSRLVYSGFTGHRQDSLHLARASMSRRSNHSHSHGSSSRRVLVFRIGQLGDTIAALPALWAVKKHFADAELTLLCDHHPGKTHVIGQDLLRDTGLFKDFELYPVRSGKVGKLRQSSDMLKLLSRLKKKKFDTLVYLSPSARTQRQILRDKRFFRAAGIKQFIGTEGFAAPPVKIHGRPLEDVPHEAELLLARLAASNIKIPAAGHGCMNLNLGANEAAEVEAWLAKRPSDGGRPWIGFGPGSKMSAKRWPLERFAEVGRNLIERFDIWPVVFGGAEDCQTAASLLAEWGRGDSAAGELSVRAAAEALKRCRLYVGNDTGTMHLAAAVNTRCVAVFSARDWPGRWYPYGTGHRVFREQIECEGCNLVECVERKNECLTRIGANEVTAACEEILKSKIGKQKAESRNA